MYTVDDIVVRYKRLRGYASLWIPGMDHAGFETQYVYEKYLSKQGKSRFDFDRKTLYDNVFTFVKENSGLIYHQFRKLGFLADWSRSVFTLDPHVITQVFNTFSKMEKEGYVYRDSYMVNYCVRCGTSLAELEANHEERVDPLYYITYGPFTIATVRPETIFGDTGIAIHPKNKKYAEFIGKDIDLQILGVQLRLKVVADDFVDSKFGTGVVKVTPAHDQNDFEVARRHSLPIKQVIGLDGRLSELAGEYKGLKIKAARQKVVEDLQAAGLIEKIDKDYVHNVSICYRCKSDLEPMIVPNWFIKVQDLKTKVKEAVEKDEVEFHPKKYKKQMLQWLDIMHDWPISRQIVWGIRIPVWYKIDRQNSRIFVWWLDESKTPRKGYIKDLLAEGISLGEIEAGLQKISVPTGKDQPKYIVSDLKPEGEYLPETDTFDTWFSSGQWPLVTLEEDEYSTRFPTDFMGTLSDILKFWISRMIMFSLYLKEDIPFKHVYLWSMVADAKGVKMSKSKGNVINPIDLVSKYGADDFRASLIFGTAQGGKVNLAEEKVIGMRNFANKVWNIGRFIHMNRTENSNIKPQSLYQGTIVKQLQKEFKEEKKKYIK
jgi:valyl-tRNA synthetase